MEYVDGEDLASLLRRIGRPAARQGGPDRAPALRRHRGRARARRDSSRPEAGERDDRRRGRRPHHRLRHRDGRLRTGREFVGTPQYMAPEQLAGAAASVKSDIYALGLILFELFTGRRAQEARRSRISSASRDRHAHDALVDRARPRSGASSASSCAASSAIPAAPGLGARRGRGAARRRSARGRAGGGRDAVAGTARGRRRIRRARRRARPRRSCRRDRRLLVFAEFAAHLAAGVPLDDPPAVLVNRAEQLIASLGYTDLWAIPRPASWPSTTTPVSAQPALGRRGGTCCRRESVRRPVLVSDQPARICRSARTPSRSTSAVDRDRHARGRARSEWPAAAISLGATTVRRAAPPRLLTLDHVVRGLRFSMLSSKPHLSGPRQTSPTCVRRGQVRIPR